MKFSVGWHSVVNDYAISGGWTCDGKLLVVSDSAGGVYVFNGISGELLWSKTKAHNQGGLATAVHPFENKFVTTGQDGKVLIWETHKSNLQKVINLGNNWVENAAWSQNGKLLAVSCSRKVHVFNEVGDEIWFSENHQSTVGNIAWSISNELATTSYGRVSFFDGFSGEVKQQLDWKGSLVSMILSPNSDIVVCGSQDNTVHFWRRSTEKDSMMSGYPLKPTSLSFDESGIFLASGGGEDVTVWNFDGDGPEGTTPLSLKFHTNPITSLTFANNCMNLASGSRDGSLAIWSLTNDKKEGTMCETSVKDSISNLFWRPDDQALAALDSQGGITVFFRQ